MQPHPTSEEIAHAVALVAYCLDHASLAELRIAHSLVEQHFLMVCERDREAQKNSETRVLGQLWAELEGAIDQRASSESDAAE